MTETIIIIIVCEAVMGMALWYYRKACQTYDEAGELVREAKEECGNVIDSVPDGYNVLPVFCIEEYEFWYAVVAFYPSHGRWFTLKEFMKEDDAGYARREAEYLLQTLNEK